MRLKFRLKEIPAPAIGYVQLLRCCRLLPDEFRVNASVPGSVFALLWSVLFGP